MNRPPGPEERTAFRLRDGREMELRRLRPNDVDRMMAHIGRVSRESIRRRFLAPIRVEAESTRRLAERLSQLDFVTQAAFAVTFPGEEEIRAIGRYADDGEGAPEVAFLVEDALQRQGIAMVLLRALAQHAHINGYTKLSAQMLTENREMLRVFRNSGYPLKLRIDGDTERVQMDISREQPEA